MIRIFDMKDISLSTILKRDEDEEQNVDKVVRTIINEVKQNGDEALFQYCAQFDKAKLQSLKVSAAEITEALNEVDEALLITIKKSAKNIEDYHRYQLREDFEIVKE